MPLTPIHIGFAVFVYSIFIFLDPIALVLGTILIDLEPIMNMIFNIGKLHGKLHSLLGIVVLTFPIAAISCGCFRLFKLHRYIKKFKWINSLISISLGLTSHIFFDGIVYSEMVVLYPFSPKTGLLLDLWSAQTNILILMILLCVGIVVLVVRYIINRYFKKNELETNMILEEN